MLSMLLVQLKLTFVYFQNEYMATGNCYAFNLKEMFI